MTTFRAASGPPHSRQLQPRLHDRIRQFWSDRRRGGRLPRTLRRVTAVALASTAVLLLVVPPEPSPGDPVVMVTRDLAVGAVLQEADLVPSRLPEAPDGALTDTAQGGGRMLAGGVRRGEVITDVRLLDPAGPQPGPGQVAVPIRPADASVTELLHPGMHVAVVAVRDDGTATALVDDAVVLQIGTAGGTGREGPPVVLAVPQDRADQVVAAALGGSVVLRFT